MFYCLQGIYQYLCHGINKDYLFECQYFKLKEEVRIFIKLIKYIPY